MAAAGAVTLQLRPQPAMWLAQATVPVLGAVLYIKPREAEPQTHEGAQGGTEQGFKRHSFVGRIEREGIS